MLAGMGSGSVLGEVDSDSVVAEEEEREMFASTTGGTGAGEPLNELSTANTLSLEMITTKYLSVQIYTHFLSLCPVDTTLIYLLLLNFTLLLRTNSDTRVTGLPIFSRNRPSVIFNQVCRFVFQ